MGDNKVVLPPSTSDWPGEFGFVPFAVKKQVVPLIVWSSFGWTILPKSSYVAFGTALSQIPAEASSPKYPTVQLLNCSKSSFTNNSNSPITIWIDSEYI